MTDYETAIAMARMRFMEAIENGDGMTVARGHLSSLTMDGVFDLNEAIDAFLSELRKTHALVPREATSGMYRALTISWFQGEEPGITHAAGLPVATWAMGTFQSDYAAMLSAAEGEGK